VPVLRGYLRFAVAGNLNLDLYFIVGRIPQPDEAVEAQQHFSRPGGAACNVSAALAKLGARVRLFGFVGSDEAGRSVLEGLRGMGVDVSGVKAVDKPTGTVVVLLDKLGRRAMVALRGANLELKPGSLSIEELSGFDHLHLSSTKPDFSAWVLSEAKRLGLTTSYDPGLTVAEQGLGALRGVLASTDVLFLNEREFTALGGDLLVERFAGLIILKRGERGSEAPQAGLRAEAFRVEAVDTTGAGDSFDAAFLLCWKLGLPLEECLLVANAAGALKATRVGAYSSPTLSELLAFLRERGLGDLAQRLETRHKANNQVSGLLQGSGRTC